MDGVLELEDQLFEFRNERSLLVRKFRGSGFLRAAILSVSPKMA